MISIFSYDSYRAYLKARVKAEKSNWGLWAKIAKAAGCQATYLTQCMKGKANLTSDHILGIAQYFELSSDEIEFFFLLLDLDRAGTPSLKKYLQDKIQKKKREREDLAKRLALPSLDVGEKEALYYSSWHWSALHIIVTIPEYQTTTAIAKRLQLPEAAVESSLLVLQKHGIVRREGGKWKLGVADIHTPRNSPLTNVHHNNWRQKAVLAASLGQSNGAHYTSVYSMSQADFEKLKSKLNDYIEYSRKIVAPSKEEVLIGFTCDLFEV